MLKQVFPLASAALALSLATAAPAQEEMTAQTVLAEVNGTEITLSHMILAYAGLPDEYRQLPQAMLWDGLLSQLINQQLLSDSRPVADSTRVRAAVENERRALRASEAAMDLAQAAATEDRLQAAYEAAVAEMGAGIEYNASHILVESETKAAELVTALRDGADFATLARQESTGPSGPGGGALGWFGPGMMVAPFQAAVEALQPGEISDPVQTQFGWHVITLNETRVAEAPSLEEMRPQLAQQVQQQAVEDAIDALVAESDVTRMPVGNIPDGVLTDLSLLED